MRQTDWIERLAVCTVVDRRLDKVDMRNCLVVDNQQAVAVEDSEPLADIL